MSAGVHADRLNVRPFSLAAARRNPFGSRWTSASRATQDEQHRLGGEASLREQQRGKRLAVRPLRVVDSHNGSSSTRDLGYPLECHKTSASLADLRAGEKLAIGRLCGPQELIENAVRDEALRVVAVCADRADVAGSVEEMPQ